MRFRVLLSVFAAMALVLVASVGATPTRAEPIVIKISHETSLDSAKGQTWEYFKKLAEERLKGKVDVRHHHSGQLYGQQENISALQSGAIQFIAPGSGIYTGLFPKFAVLEFPYLYNPQETLRKVVASPDVGPKLFGDMPSKGLMFVAVWLNGYRIFGDTKKPVRKLEDLQGLKVRVPGGKVYRDVFQALGANVVSVNWNEIVTALQQGTVDAIEPTANNWEADKLYEIAPYLTETNHILSNYVIATNYKWWTSLPADIRDELKKILDETTEYNWRMTTQQNQKAIDNMKASGKAQVIGLSGEEMKRWIDRGRTVHKKYEDVVGKDIMEAIYRIVGQSS